MITSVSFAGLALLFGLTNGLDAYEKTCNPPSGEKEVSPSILATFGCGQTYEGTGLLKTGGRVPAASPEQCAIACSQRSPDGPCSWFSNNCYFYEQGTSSGPTRGKVVTITVRKKSDQLQADYDQLQKEYSHLNDLHQAQVAKCDSDLKACQEKSQAYSILLLDAQAKHNTCSKELKDSQGKYDTCMKELKDSQDKLSKPPAPADDQVPDCPSGPNGPTSTAEKGSRKWSIECGRYRTTGQLIDYKPAKSLDECIGSCTDRCNAVSFQPTSTFCRRFERFHNVPGRPDSNYHIAWVIS